ncbi:MAG: DUF1566 domain-containing protein [Proteobacteria bacterium]|nr:DUF1566 domain-containing protein [Pseudomonadota bacterium]
MTAAPRHTATRNAKGAVVTTQDARTGLEWSATLSAKRVTHAAAAKLVAKLNKELAAGEPQWRMPTVEELFLIADRTKRMPAIDTEAFPDTKSDWYWTSTISAWSSDYAWIVSFDGGYSDVSHRDYDVAFVRAVRELPASQSLGSLPSGQAGTP